ncbi:MAG: hypothetical protein FWE90_01690 [Defluviitaleaceae bacterium]|nr:hypothetical protein [Defluviitaleaceae bacterium]
MELRNLGLVFIALFTFEFTITAKFLDKIESSLILCIIKKIIDIIFLFVFYFGFIFLVTYPRNANEYLLFVFFSILLLVGFFVYINYRYKNNNKIINRLFHGLSVIYDFLCIIVFFSLIYYFLYSYNNLWFEINIEAKIPQIAFEFIYFSFTVTITYAGSEISINGIVPKIIQMLHIFIFYFYFANIIIETFNKKNDVRYDEKIGGDNINVATRNIKRKRRTSLRVQRSQKPLRYKRSD